MHIVRACRELILPKISLLTALAPESLQSLVDIRRVKVLETIFFFFIFFLPTQFGKHFWPDFSFINGIRIDYLSPTLYVTDILVVCFIFFSFLKYGKNIFPPKSVIFIYLFFAIGIFLSKNPLAGWYYLAKFSEYLFLGFCLTNFFQSLFSKLFLWIPLSITIIFESILGLWQFTLQSSVGGIFYFFGERTFSGNTPGIANASLNGQLILRPYATFSHPNVFAAFLCLGMIILFFLLSDSKTKKEKFILLFTIALGTVALFSTLSRTATVLWTLFLLGVVFIKTTYKQKIFFSVTLIIFISLSYFFLPNFWSRFLNVGFSQESFSQRILLLQIAWKMIVTHSLFGVGFANFLSHLPEFLPQSSVFLLQPVHNIFVLVFAETGVVGVLLFFSVFYKCFLGLKILNKNANRSKKISLYSLYFLFFSVIVLGSVDHYFLTIQQGQLLFVLVLSLLFSFPKKFRKHGTMRV